MVEDGVQAMIGEQRLGPKVGRLVGYAWVLSFIVWTSPVWVFPYALRVRKEDAVLSFGAVKPVFGFGVQQR